MSKKLTEKVLTEETEKISDAYTDKNGKIFIKESYPYSEGDKGMYYVVSKELKLERLVSDFAKNLIDNGKAILIRKEDWDAFKISSMKQFS